MVQQSRPFGLLILEFNLSSTLEKSYHRTREYSAVSILQMVRNPSEGLPFCRSSSHIFPTCPFDESTIILLFRSSWIPAEFALFFACRHDRLKVLAQQRTVIN